MHIVDATLLLNAAESDASSHWSVPTVVGVIIGIFALVVGVPGAVLALVKLRRPGPVVR
jgi:hypothetical protein